MLDCTTWECVNGNGDDTPPSQTNGGYRVIPMLTNLGPLSPIDPGPSGQMQNDW